MYIRIGDTIINTNRLVTARIEGDGREVVLTMAGGENLTFTDGDAEKFLISLPVYEPVMEPGEE